MRPSESALDLLRPRLSRILAAIALGALSLGSALALAGVSAWLITRAWQMPPVLDLSIAIARLQQARALQAVQEEATGPTVDFDTEVSEDKLSKDSELYANIPSTPGVKTQFLNTQIGFDAAKSALSAIAQ